MATTTRFPSDVHALRRLLATDNQLIFPNADGLLPEGPEEGEARLISDIVLKRMCLILKYITVHA
uniref:Uncharacterized protein n=1 Tax=Oryza rufipogon TaxID=4529 RepID=A0A0E0NLG7_ORYRU